MAEGRLEPMSFHCDASLLPRSPSRRTLYLYVICLLSIAQPGLSVSLTALTILMATPATNAAVELLQGFRSAWLSLTTRINTAGEQSFGDPVVFQRLEDELRELKRIFSQVRAV